MTITQAGTGFREAPFVARETEMAQLRRVLDEGSNGTGSVVLIGGEAGIGKTRLVSEMAAAAEDGGFMVLSGHCYPGGGAAPYLVFVEVIDDARRVLSDDEMARAVGDERPALARLVPRLAPAGARNRAPLPAEHERLHLFNAVGDFLSRVSAGRPLLVVLEDLQWAEDATLLMLRHLGRELAQTPIVVAATYRSADTFEPDASTAAAIENLHRLQALRVDVASLSRGQTEELATAIAGRRLPGRLAGAVHDLTEGNPFFVEEVVKHLADEGRLDGHDMADSADDLAIPESVRLVIGRRLDRITADTRRVLLAAAVLGRTFDHALLAGITEMNEERLVDCLDEAERARLVVSGTGRYAARLSFVHELIRQSLLSEVSAPRRQRLHAQALAALETHSETPERALALAYHAARAGGGVPASRVISYLSDAATIALAATDYEAAARFLREAIDLGPPDSTALRCTLLLRLGEAMRRETDSDEARAVFADAARLARQLDDPALVARAALGMSRSWPTIGAVDEEAVALLRESASAVEEPALRAQLLSRLSLQTFYVAGAADTQALSEEAVAAARASGDDMALARTLQVRHITLWEPEHLEERLAVSREILAVADRTGVREIGLWGYRTLIADLMELGDVEAAEAVSEAYSRLAEACRQPIFLWQAAVRRAMLAIHRGRLVDGERLATEALELGRAAGGQNLMAAYGEQLLAIRWLQGRLGEIEPLARASVKAQPHLTLWRAVLAFILRETGRGAEAREEFELIAANGFAALPVADTRLIAVLLLAVVSAGLKDSARSGELYQMLLPYEGRGVVLSEGVVSAGAGSHYLGVLAAASRDFAAAERHFEDANSFNERAGGVPWLAVTRLEYARMLLSRRLPGNRKQARLLLEGALADARRLGLGAVEAAARTLLDSHTGGAGELPAGLTRREAEVLKLVASGMSNREISEALVLSPRTTARHVTNIYAKIGARNRADATAYALRHGLTGV